MKLSNIITQLKPDVCLIHGDRFDALSAAIAVNQSIASFGAETTGRRMNNAYVTFTSPKFSTVFFDRLKYTSAQREISSEYTVMT